MGRSLTVRDATLDDAAFVAERLRARDYDEVVASAGTDVPAILRASVLASVGMAWTAESDRPVLLLGCAPVLPGVGSPWLLGTEEAARYPGALTRIAKRHIAIMLQTYGALVNYVDARNADSVGWLRMLGFTVDKPTPYGAQGRLFHRFTMRGV